MSDVRPKDQIIKEILDQFPKQDQQIDLRTKPGQILLKRKAQGDGSIPTNHRVYVILHLKHPLKATVIEKRKKTADILPSRQTAIKCYDSSSDTLYAWLDETRTVGVACDWIKDHFRLLSHNTTPPRIGLLRKENDIAHITFDTLCAEFQYTELWVTTELID